MEENQEHIKALRLFDLGRDAHPTEGEKEHLRQCEECWTCRAIFMRISNRQKRKLDKPDNAA
jgi:hypothetical protein